MSVSSIPSTFLAGFRDRLTTDTLQLLWNNRSDTEKQQLTKQASIAAPPAGFLPNPNVTSLAREAAWLGLTDAQRSLYLGGSSGVTSSGLISNAGGATSYRQSGFGSQATTTPSTAAALDLTGRLDTLSATPDATQSAAYRAIWKENFASSSLLDVNGSAGDANGGAIFVTIRAGTGSERAANPYADDTTKTTDPYSLFETQVTDQVKGITDRFGTAIAVLGYDANGNGYLDSEAELFGFDGSTAGPALTAQGLLSDRLMVLTAAGQSVKINQSSFATTANSAAGGYLPYTTARTVLQRSATDGTLEIVVGSSVGLDTPPAAPKVAWIGLPNGSFSTGQNLDVAVTFNRDVTITGTDSTLALQIGGATRQATFQSASGSTAIYRYVLTTSDEDTDGVTVPADPITLNTSTIKDADANDADLTSASVTNAGTLVPRVVPTVTGVAIPGGTYKAGDTLAATLTFSETMVFDTAGGTPTLALTIGSNTRQAALTGTTSTTATFGWVVQGDDLDGNGVTVAADAVTLNGGTIRDTSSNAADLSNTALATSSAIVDGIAPAAPSALDLATADDTGLSATDNLTRNTSGLTVAGTGETGATARIYRDVNDDGTVDGGDTLLGSATVAGGAFSIDVSLPEAVNELIAQQTDAAGNVGAASSALTVTVDTTAPAAPGALDLAAADDTGLSATDDLTRNTSGLTIAGTGETGATMRIYRDVNGDGTVDGGDTLLGSATVAGGAFSIDVSLPEAANELIAQQTDAAGNIGAASSVLTVTVDTTAPSAPAALDLDATDDTGLSATDDLTRNTGGLTIAGTGETGATMRIYRDADGDGTVDGGDTLLGSATVAGGVFSIDVSLPEGVNELIAQQTDAAGNVGAVSSALTVTVDATAPSATSYTTPPAAGSYSTGATVSFTLGFDEALTLTSGSDVTVEVVVNGTTKQAEVTDGDGSGLTALTFAYVVESTDTGSGFEIIADTLTVGGSATLTDAAGNPVALVNPAFSDTGLTFN